MIFSRISSVFLCYFSFFKVENLRFSPIFIVFYSIIVSSLAVPLYGSRSSAEDFRSDLCRPGVFSGANE